MPYGLGPPFTGGAENRRDSPNLVQQAQRGLQMKQAGNGGARNNHNNASCPDLLTHPAREIQDMSEIPADIENRQRQRPIKHRRERDLIDTSQKAANSFE